MDLHPDSHTSQLRWTAFPSSQTENGYSLSLPHHEQQQHQQQNQQQSNGSLSFSPDDYNQIMTSNIGSVLPSRDSVAGFMDDPRALLDIGNVNNFFDIACAPLDLHAHNASSYRTNDTKFHQDLTDNQNTSRDIQQSDHLRSIRLLQQKSQLLQFQQRQHQRLYNAKQAIPSLEIPRSSPSSSRSDLFSMPDHFSQPIDDDLFGDDQSFTSEPIIRKDPNIRVAPSPIVLTSPVSTPSFSLLHQACYLYPSTLAVVNSALGVDKANLRRRVATPAPPGTATTTNDSDNGPNKRQKRPDSFSLPLHIAVDRDGSLEVLRALAEASPDVVAMTDGPVSCNAISAHLYKKYHNLGIISMLIKANPEAVKVPDRYKHTCLHVACAQGAPLEIVELIYTSYPDALQIENFHGQRPLEVAERTGICPLNVIDFIQKLVCDPLERKASHLVDSDPEA
jgi:hypothetical protein